ncbi:hypothetical protein AVEN_250260-1 [Araneus ventricosus]|uniref:Reverse transcriptase domain-containing protein n=1 Tax=Araneus ventricosus TaxID=182803 RepID=A0A4Y2FEW6_ARAVE|nr:hypothetical protein AVEN_250260-1 [Araneus ventricosus]
MQEKFLPPNSTICELINAVNEFQTNTVSLTKQSIVETLKENNVNENVLNLVLNNPAKGSISRNTSAKLSASESCSVTSSENKLDKEENTQAKRSFRKVYSHSLNSSHSKTPRGKENAEDSKLYQIFKVLKMSDPLEKDMKTTEIEADTLSNNVNSLHLEWRNIEHNLDETHQLIHSLQGEDYLLGADLNAHSQTWGYTNTDTRGEKVSDFISSINGHLLNTKDAPPTFIQRDSKGWPYLSIASSSVLAVNSDWQVLDNIESYSDHKIISITINKDQHILKYNRFKTIFGGHKKFSTILKSKAHSILKRISDTVNPEDIDDLTVFIQQELNFACRKAYKLKKTPTTPTISWWNSNLETKKKEITAPKRRAERSNGLVKTHFEIKAKMKLSIFKKEVLQAKRNSFKKNCSQENEGYGKFFKLAFQKTAPPADIFSQINNDHNGSPLEIAQSILQSLYPITSDVTAQNTSSQPHNLEPPFTNKELKTIIKTLPNNKAPGNDGIDFIIIKQIFKSCPSILRNFFNKCLQFQRFPTSLKEGIIVLFHKKRKEPRNISSYRPITLLPTLGKLLEKLLLQRFNYYLEKNNKLHDQQYGFRQGKSVDLALSTLVSKLEEAKRKDIQTLFISIDIKAAFDNLQYSSIKNSIDKIATK